MVGSPQIFGHEHREVEQSVNFITCHDGFTLNDLVSYNGKHNDDNGEGNRDGSDDNHSWNCGAEGVTGDQAIAALRRQMMKNYSCYLLFSSGTPMILGGDEFARTQHGNNNAYCQDNEISWFDWDAAASNQDLTEFFRKAIALTRRFPILQRRKFYLGTDLDADGVPDLTWFSADLGLPTWQDTNARTICVQLDASEDGTNCGVDRLFFVLNGHHESQRVLLPPLGVDRGWHRSIDTSLPAGEDFLQSGEEVEIDPADHYIVNPRSTVLLLAQPSRAVGASRQSGPADEASQ